MQSICLSSAREARVTVVRCSGNSRCKRRSITFSVGSGHVRRKFDERLPGGVAPRPRRGAAWHDPAHSRALTSWHFEIDSSRVVRSMGASKGTAHSARARAKAPEKRKATANVAPATPERSRESADGKPGALASWLACRTSAATDAGDGSSGVDRASYFGLPPRAPEGPRVQLAAIAVGAPDDVHERHADAVAERVKATPAPRKREEL